jgi:AcrR family transcriptional regulator
VPAAQRLCKQKDAVRSISVFSLRFLLTESIQYNIFLIIARPKEKKVSRITKPVEERRQEIVDTARRLFLKSGFNETAIAEIAQEINVAQGLVYHYFKSKTELLYAVIDQLSEEKEVVIQNTIAGHDGSARECLGLLLSVMGETELNGYGKLFTSLMGDLGIMEYVSKKITLSKAPTLLSLIERGNRDGSWNCPHPKEAAIFILHGMNNIVESFTQDIDSAERRQVFADIILRILGDKQQK